MKRLAFLISLFLMFSISIFAQKVEEVENPIFAVVEDMPSFPTCDTDENQKCTEAKFKAFIAENMQYPEYAFKNGVEGICVITCVVEKDGSLTDFKIVRNIGAGTGEEALRIIQLLPNFKAGKQRGKAKQKAERKAKN